MEKTKKIRATTCSSSIASCHFAAPSRIELAPAPSPHPRPLRGRGWGKGLASLTATPRTIPE
ncbi:hypothetical protein BKA80DRAFT_277929 [Phyllosticta citrichinensis]